MKTIIFVWSFFFYYLLDELDASLQIETEVDEGPRDTLALVLLQTLDGFSEK